MWKNASTAQDARALGRAGESTKAVDVHSDTTHSQLWKRQDAAPAPQVREVELDKPRALVAPTSRQMQRASGRGSGSVVIGRKRPRTQIDEQHAQSMDGLTLISWNLEGLAPDQLLLRTEVR